MYAIIWNYNPMFSSETIKSYKITWGIDTVSQLLIKVWTQLSSVVFKYVLSKENYKYLRSHYHLSRRHKTLRFNPWVRKIPWRRTWQPTPVFLPGESPWTEEPSRLQSMGLQIVGCDWSDSTHTHKISLFQMYIYHC